MKKSELKIQLLHHLTSGESDNEDLTPPPPPPKIKSFQEAMSTLDVKYFFESSDCFNLASSTSSLIDNVVVNLHIM